MRREGDLEVWSRDLKGGDRAVLLLNRGVKPAPVHFAWSDVGYPEAMTLRARDVWAGQELGTLQGHFATASLPAHGVQVLLLRP